MRSYVQLTKLISFPFSQDNVFLKTSNILIFVFVVKMVRTMSGNLKKENIASIDFSNFYKIALIRLMAVAWN